MAGLRLKTLLFLGLVLQDFQAESTSPGLIKNLTISQITNTSVALDWIGPEGNAGFYRVYWSNGNVNQNQSTSNTSIAVGGLAAGTPYTFSVTAVAGDNQTVEDAVNISLYTRPGPIRNLTVIQITSTSVALGWIAPGGNAAFYRVYWSNGNVNQNQSTSNTSIAVGGLAAGTPYTFSVTAVAGDNQTVGDAVNISLYTRPGPIKNLTISQITSTSVALGWIGPEGNAGFYRVYWSNGNVNQNQSTSNTSIAVGGLAAGTPYTFSVTAVAGDNQTVGDAVNISLYTRPGPIRNLTVIQITNTSVALDWIAPEGNAAFYRVYWSNGNVNQNQSTSNTSIAVGGLTAGTPYTFSVTAVAGDNQTVGDAVNISLYTRPGPIRNLTVIQITNTSVALDWIAPEGNAAFYRVYWNNGNVNQNQSTSNTSIAVGGLAAGTPYTFSVTAVAGDNQTVGDAVNISLYTRPGPIRNLTVIQITSTSVALGWIAPGGNAAFYRVYWSNGNVNQNQSTSNTSIAVGGLAAGTPYTFSVTAVAGDNQTVGDAVNISLYTRPGPIRNLTVIQITSTSVALGWIAPGGNAAFYRVYWSNGNVNQNQSTSNTSIAVGGLAAGTPYTFSVTAVAGDNQTVGDAVNISLYTRPGPIRNLTVIQITSTSVALGWIAPGGNAAFYRVYWSNGNVNQNQSTSNTSIAVGGLAAGTPYTFSVTAVAGDNQTVGDAVNISLYTRPGPIRNLTVIQITSTSVALGWIAPGGNAAFYRVYWSNGNVNQNQSTSNTSIAVGGLAAGTPYTFSVTAVAGDNQTVGDAVNISLYTRPGPIRNLTVIQITNTSVALGWIVPEGNAAFYRVYWSNGNVNQNQSTSNTSIAVGGLAAGTPYTFSVTAVAGDNQTVGDAVNISLYTRPGPIRNLTVIQITSTSVALGWIAPGGNAAFYRVYWSNGNVNQNQSTSNTSIAVGGLAAGTPYTFSVTAVAGDNQTVGDAVNISLYTRPGPIRNLTVIQITSTSVALGWIAPGGNAAFYRVYWSNGNVNQNQSTSNTSIAVGGLAAGTPYTFSVTAVAGDNQTVGDAVNISLYTRPGPIRNLTVIQITSTSVALGWIAPGGNAAFYRVYWSNGNVNQNQSTSNTSIAVGGLAAGTPYTFSVTAVAGDNQTVGDAVNISLYTRPGPIRNLTVIQITNTSVALGWIVPEGNAAFYRVYWSNGNVNQNQSTSNTSIAVGGLAAGTPYTFSVTAVAGDNQTVGDAVNISLYTRPGPIRNLTVIQITSTSVALGWIVPEGNAAFYRVYWSNGNVNQNQSTSNTSIAVGGLAAGTPYTFSVTAVAGDNQTVGDAVNISLYTRPGPIRNLTVIQITSTSVALGWIAPGGNAAFYRVYWSNGNVNQNQSTSNTSIAVGGLAAGTPYTFSVTAVAGDNQTVGDAVNISLYTRPGPIRNLTVIQITSTSVALGWIAPGGNAAFYRVYWSNGNVNQNQSTSNTSIAVGGLAAGTPYTFSVTAVAGDNQTVGDAVNISLYTRPGPIRNLTVIQITSTSVALGWIAPGGNAAFYRVYWSNGNVNQNQSTSNTSIAVGGLAAGTPYTFSVTAVAGDNQTVGDAVNISLYTRPGPIRNLTVIQITSTSVALGWIAPGGNAAFYRVYWSNGNVNQNQSTSNTSIAVGGLAAGTPYTFSVTAVAGDNQTVGDAVNISLYTRPNSVTNLRSKGTNTSSVTLNWEQADAKDGYKYLVEVFNGTSPVQNHTVSTTSTTVANLQSGSLFTFNVTTQAAGGTPSAPTSVSVSTTPYSIQNLTVVTLNTTALYVNWGQPSEYQVGYKYTVNISGSTANEQSQSVDKEQAYWTELIPGTNYTVTVTTMTQKNVPGLPVSTSQYTKPEKVNLTISNGNTSNSIMLNWTAPLGNADQYLVSLTGPQQKNMSLNSTFTSYNFTNLTAGTVYNATVITISGPFEAVSQVVSTATYPNLPGAISITGKNTSSLSLTWEPAFPTGINFSYRVQYQSSTTNLTTVSSTTNSINLENLTSGTSYNISVATVGPMDFHSGPVWKNFITTRPNSVTNLRSKGTNTSSVTLNWEQADAKDGYKYLVEVFNGTSPVQNHTVSTTSTTVANLQSGSLFTFNVTTQAADGTPSAPTSVSVSTTPYSIQNLTVVTLNTTALYVNWGQPSEYQVGYKYTVNISGSTANEQSQSVDKEQAYWTELIPGTNYTVTVTTMTQKNVPGLPVSTSQYTNFAPPLNFNCSSPDGKSAELNLTWNNPPGSNLGFAIRLRNVTKEMTVSCCNYTVTNLSYYTNYVVDIWTVGQGKNSVETNITCRTGITIPPLPDTDFISFPQRGHQTFVLELNSSIFSDIYGPIVNYGVLVGSKVFSNESTAYLKNTYNEETPFLAVMRNRTQVVTKQTSSDVISVTIGDGSKWEKYYNGPLIPKGTYRVAVVLFTRLQTQDGLINPAQSLFTISMQLQVTINENPAVIGGIIAGILAALIIIVAIAVIFWIRRRKSTLTEIPIQSMRAKVSVPVRVEDYENYFKRQCANSNCGFAEEFEDLKTVGVAQSKTSALMPENKVKNRYNNVLPYDFSRVKLSVQGNPCDDYINANYMPGYSSRKEFIATQGPLPGTVNDFWRMIWEKNVRTLVMLTRCNEQGRVKCEMYWPSESKHYDNIIVTTTSDIALDDWTIREFSVKNVKTAETRFVRQFHFTAWPDHGVPETTELLINFRYLVREHMDQNRNSPTVVHCSAGVGRTGTFVAIDRLIYQTEIDGVVDVFGAIHDMRMHRPLMVQTEDQYVFLSQCVMDIIRSRSGTNVDLIYQNAAALAIYENVNVTKGTAINGFRRT